MFDRVGSLAERVATDVSRRAVLGRLGQGALGFAAVIGGVLSLPCQAQAGGKWCVRYFYPFRRPAYCLSYPAVKGRCPCGGQLSDSHGRCGSMTC
jgi:hypothetical protein